MISAFLSKLLTTRQASFTEEGIEIFDLNFNMQPLLSLVRFQNETNDGEKMGKLGYFISESIITHFKKRFAIEEKKMTNLWTNLFDISGFGKVEIVDVTKERTILKLDKSNFAKLYMENYGIQKQPVCHLLGGIFKNFVEKTNGTKVDVKETSCIAMGNRVCTFELKTMK
jgi:predicted hydrocarbon binding protein